MLAVRGGPAASARVFCLPYAGGSSLAFRQWHELGDGIEVLTPDYPGHLFRSAEPLVDDLGKLVRLLFEELSPGWDKPFVLCGASLGGLVAFELTRAAEAAGYRPLALVLAACAAPNRMARRSPLADLADDASFIAAINERYGRLDGALWNDPDARDIILPMMRADMAAFESFQVDAAAPVAADIVAISGQDDRAVSYADVAAWSGFTEGRFDLRSAPGGHFLMEVNPGGVLGEVRSLIARKLASPEELARCPIVNYPMERVHPLHPPADYTHLRSTTAVVRAHQTFDGGRDIWLITRYREAKEVLNDTRFSSNSRLPGFPVRRTPSALIRMDPPEHTTYREMLNAEFVGRRVTQLRPAVQELVDQLLDGIEEAGQPCDLVPMLAMPLPSLVICRILGVPDADHVYLQERTTAALRADATEAQIDEAVEDLGRFMDTAIERKFSEPGDDILSRLIEEQVRTGRCSRETAADLARLLLVAGHVTTVHMIGLGILTLLEHPDQWEELRAHPELIGSAVNELLRFLTISPTVSRVATEDIEVDGVMIRAGDGVTVLLSSADRDPLQFYDPDLFDIHRKDGGHLAFGFGPHLCLGAALARMELQVVIGAVLKRFPSLRLTNDLDAINFRNRAMFYGVHELPVTWEG
ncbi:cytochrome P450 [Streptomyces sp. NPDC006996]|uniref:cytochrome P450 n=1 Tax=Streptomyces sp. NPDC006996 TaxID=3156908 RepID=UPI0034102C5B